MSPPLVPASRAQQRLWCAEQLAGHATSGYHITNALRCWGRLDVEAMGRAVDTVIARHSALRTRFSESGDRLVQIVDPPRPTPLSVQPLAAAATGGRDAALVAACVEDNERAFNLACEWPVRVRLVQVGPDDHVLLRTTHHIVSDGWSEALFDAELFVVYDAFRNGHPNPLPPPECQYTDFLQETEMLGQADSCAFEYWLADLDGAPQTIEWPMLRSRPPRPTIDGTSLVRDLPTAAERGLKRLTAAAWATPYMVQVAALAALVARYTGARDIVIGSPMANRTHRRTQRTIGPFVNLVALRIPVVPSKSFVDLVQAVRDRILATHRYQHVPFQDLVKALCPRRQPGMAPLVQVVCNQAFPATRRELAGLCVEPVRVPQRYIRFELEVHVYERGSAMATEWLASRDLFEEWQLEAMVDQYLRLLEHALAHPGRPVGDIEIVGGEERRLIENWSAWGELAP